MEYLSSHRHGAEASPCHRASKSRLKKPGQQSVGASSRAWPIAPKLLHTSSRPESWRTLRSLPDESAETICFCYRRSLGVQ